MQSLRILILLLVVSPLGYGQQQYSEGACILLQQQADRFAHQPQNSNYRSAMREYDKYCRKPVAVRQRPIGNNTQPLASAAEVVKPVQDIKPVVESVTIQVQTEAAVTPVTPIEATASIAADSTVNQDSTESAPALIPGAAPTEADAAVVATAGNSTALANAKQQTSNSEATQPVLSLPPVAASGDTAEPAFAIDALLITLLNNMPLIAANIFALLAAIFLLTSWLGFNLPGFKGVFAEYKLNRLLRWRLPRQYLHFRKLKLLTAKDEPTMIDHLVLCPAGIFVIAVRTNRGRISGSETAANWTRQYFGSSKQLMNPLHQNYKNIRAVQHLLQLQNGDASECLHSVVAFSRVARFDSQMPANVTYVDAVAAYIKQFDHSCFTDEQVARFAALLKQASTD